MTVLKNSKYVVFLDGPIGVGKTTFGRSLAREFSSHFLDGDDFAHPNKPWYASSLSTSRKIFQACLARLEDQPLVFVGYPVRCFNWIFFKRHFESEGIETVFVGLQATIESINSKARHRTLSASEIERSVEMIKQGYGHRPFSDFFVQTDAGDIGSVTDSAANLLRQTFTSKIP